MKVNILKMQILNKPEISGKQEYQDNLKHDNGHGMTS